LSAIKDLDQLFDPHEFDWEGYMIVLGISAGAALSLDHVFGTIGPPDRKRKDYEKLSQDLREKFEKCFRPNFGE